MRILIVSSFFPYPLYSGGYIRLFNLMKQLSKSHEITLVAEKRSKQRVTEDYIKEIKKICKEVIIISSKKQWSLQNIAQAGFSPYPFLLTGHTSQEMKQAIIRILKNKTFDLIHVETFYVMQNLPKTYLPIVLSEHNIEYEVYEKFAKTAKIFLRPFLFADIAKIKYWEKNSWREATKVIAVSSSDQQKMLPIEAAVVPNGVDLQTFSFQKSIIKQKKKEKRILFIGDFKWIQNQDTARWILKEIWPQIVTSSDQHEVSSLKLWIVGKHIPDFIKEFGGKNVIFDEDAPDDTAKIYQNAFALLAPIKVGGGTSYKILESMASGLPVVTTELGIQGIGARHKKEVLVGQTSAELAKNLMSLLEDNTLFESLAVKARELIEEKYSWKQIAKLLENVYREALVL